MNSGRFILSQILDLVDRKMLYHGVERYDAESRVRHFGCRQQLICMVFAPLTWREGLRDIATCLNARPSTLHHLGFSQHQNGNAVERGMRGEEHFPLTSISSIMGLILWFPFGFG